MRTLLHGEKPRGSTARFKGALWVCLTMLGLGSFTAKAQTAMSGTYTVCSSGCDYSTVQGAVDDLVANGVNGKTTIYIKGGNYNEQVTIGAISGASSSNTVTFKGDGRYGTNRTRIYYTGSYKAVEIKNASYLIITDLAIEASGTASYSYPGGGALHITKGDHIIVQNCRVAGTGGGYYDYGLFAGSCTNNTYQNNRIESGFYNMSYDYYVGGYGKNDTIRYNTMVGGYQYGYYCYYGNGNQVYKNRFDSIGYTYGYVLYTNYEYGANYYDNDIHGGYYGMYFYTPNGPSTSSPFNFYNNFVTCTGYYTLFGYDFSSGGGKNVHILHNTFYSNYSGYVFYMYNYYGSSGWDIRNNNFYNDQTGSSVFWMQKLGASDMVSGNNYYQSSGTLITVNSTTYKDISSWQAAVGSLGLGKYDQSVQTVFTAAPTDLHYASTSPLPWGKYAGIATDYDGDKRCTLFATSGADEGTPNTSTPVSSFTSPKKMVDGYPAVFKNGAKITEPKAYRWYVDGKYVSDSIDLFTTSLKAPSAKVTLVTLTCGGKDSLTKTFTVDSPKKAPVTDFISNINVVRAGEVVKFNDLSINYPSKWAWDVSPRAYNYYGSKVPTFQYAAGDSTKPNVDIRFTYPGKYKICLTTSNIKGSGGTECKSDYIEVLGSYNMTTSGTTIKDGKGYLYDEGGPTGNYGTYHTTKATIDPSCAKTVYLIFNKFDLYCGYDYVKIWDGTNSKGTSLNLCSAGMTGGPSSVCYSGVTCIPKVTDTFVATSGKMYIEMSTQWQSFPGFEAYFWSDPKPQAAANASFTSSDSVCTNSSVDFINTSTGDDLQYQWDMDGDMSYFEDTRKNTSYPFIFPGQYTITLIASNCNSVDTFQKTITVFDPPKPKVAFHADNTNPTTNDIVYLIPDIKQCVDDYKWEVKKKYGAGTITYMNGTSSASQIPQVTLSDTGCYDVALVASNVSGSDSAAKHCYIFVKNPYCTPSVSNTITDLGISEVKVNTIDNISKQSGGYENYTPTVSTQLEIGVSYPFTISRKTSANTAVRTVYIDWNADGDFQDTLETIAIEKPGRSLSWTDTIVVPAFAKTGATVMRVSIIQSSQTPDPCTNSFGEYEDYRLYISNDKTPPVITMIGADTIRIEQGYTFTDPGATALDNLSGNITSRIVINKGGFDILTPGTYIFTYNVKDDAGNAAVTKKRVVIVTPDQTAADLQIDADDTIMVGVFTSFTEPTSSAWDLVDGDLSADVKVNDPVDINVVDTYTVSYQVTDANNNTAKKNIIVIVADTSAPVLTLNGASTIYHNVNTPYTDASVQEMDNYYKGMKWDSLMRSRIQVQSNLDVTKLGTYTITYSLTDPSGNTSPTLTRTIIVQDTMAPVVTLNGGTPITLEVFSTLNDLGITVKDNYYTSFTIDTSGTFYDAFPGGKATKLGKYTIVYKITDGSGNVTTVTREVNVVDTEAPVISLISGPVVNVCRWANYQDSGYSVKDNYWTGSGITVTSEGSFVSNQTLKEGVFYLRYKAVDSSGNVAYSDWRIINVLGSNSPDCYTGIVDSKELDRYFSVYPNPSSGVFTVTSNLSTEKEVRIKVTNLLGQEISVANSQVLGKGQFQVDLSNQASGVYLLNIYTNNQVITKRIVISK